MGPRLILLAALSCPLLLGGCGGAPEKAAGAQATVPVEAGVAPDPIGDDGITAIDAALGDGRAMPADSSAPSAYDLAARAAAHAAAVPAAAAASPAAPDDADELPRGNDSVTVGD